MIATQAEELTLIFRTNTGNRTVLITPMLWRWKQVDPWAPLASQPTLLGTRTIRDYVQNKMGGTLGAHMMLATMWMELFFSVVNSTLLFSSSAVGVTGSLPGELQIFGDYLDRAGTEQFLIQWVTLYWGCDMRFGIKTLLFMGPFQCTGKCWTVWK